MRREVRRLLEIRRDQLILQHCIWHMRPWYQRAWLTLTFRKPEAL
jgi:hypothetical protein